MRYTKTIAFAALILLSSCVPVVINGVRVNDKRSGQFNKKQRTQITAIALVGAATWIHFYKTPVKK